MADEYSQPETQPEVQPDIQPDIQPEVTGLPSEQPTDDTFNGFELNDDLKAKFKNGKLNGRFSSIDDVLVKLKEAEDFRANTIREQKAPPKPDTKAIQSDVLNELLPGFLDNDMQLTPEIEAKVVEAGIDIRDLKLGALELREMTQKAYSVVGGAEEYKSMIAWGKDNMTDAQKNAFDKDVTSGVSEFAIEGLHARYKASSTSDDRIHGSVTTQGIAPYSDRRELYKDKDYIESAAGRRDTAALKRYRTRLKITPDSVIYGR